MSFTNEFKKEVLLQYEKGKSQMALEQEFKVSRETIRKWLKQAGLNEHWYKAKYVDKDIVIKMYQNGLSVLKIAKELQLGRRPIESILMQNNILKRDNSTALIRIYGGKKNPNYKGGNARDLLKKVIPKLNQVISVWTKIILSLDNFKCQICKQDYDLLDAHHIIPIRKIYRDNLDLKLLVDINNGISLCRPCHLSFHMHEEKFEQQFKKLIKNRVNSVETLQTYLFSLLQDNTEPK